MGAKVARLFPNATVVCLASGPSLTTEDVEYCRGKAPVIAVNDTHRMAPFADVLYACDAKWWEHHRGVPGFYGLKFALQSPAGRWPGVTVLKNDGVTGLAAEPSALCTGKNSGYQAINLAVHLGARRIVLLGYDMQSTGGKTHWFGDHPRALQQTAPYRMFLSMFDTIVQPLAALGITVLNCTRQTALKCFPRVSLEEALADRPVAA